MLYITANERVFRASALIDLRTNLVAWGGPVEVVADCCDGKEYVLGTYQTKREADDVIASIRTADSRELTHYVIPTGGKKNGR